MIGEGARPVPQPRVRVPQEEWSRSVAQPGSALAWGARGPEFKSRRSDQYLRAIRNPTVSAFVSAFEKWGRQPTMKSDRSAAARKAAKTRKRRAAARKAAKTRVRK